MKACMSEVLGPPKAFLPGRRLRQSQPVLLGSGAPCALRGGAAPGQCTGAAQTPHGQRVEGLGLRLPLLQSPAPRTMSLDVSILASDDSGC